MSPAATANPPQPFFPQRNATPSMHHSSAPSVIAAHFAPRRHGSKRRGKHLSSGSSLPKKSSSPPDSLSLSFEVVHMTKGKEVSRPGVKVRPSVCLSGSSASVATSSPNSAVQDETMAGRVTPTPSMSTSCSASFVTTPLATPASSRASSVLQPDAAVMDPQNGLGLQAESLAATSAPAGYHPQARISWVPNFGKMAKAVVNSGMNMGISFEKRKKEGSPKRIIPVANAVAQVATPRPFLPSGRLLVDGAMFKPSLPAPKPTTEELEMPEVEAVAGKRRDWAVAEQKRVKECARLCSQWPHSGYNQSKWGPNGAKLYYEPQSYANPEYVASVMQRQAELERLNCTTAATFYSCRRSRASSTDETATEPGSDIYDSSQPSSITSSLSADISAAMASPLLPTNHLNASEFSLLLTTSPKPLRGARSISDLDSVTLDSWIYIDTDLLSRPSPATRPVRALSCGSKRPLAEGEDEEEKRRKVEEAMVVEEAVNSGVIVPAQMPTGSNRQLAASTPDLSAPSCSAPSDQPAVFGHVVKTSDTHPIIVSPFFPDEIISTISENIIYPKPASTHSFAAPPPPLLLSSKIDVPSLLLSCAATVNQKPQQPLVVPSPISSTFEAGVPGMQIGNLLLSSCPGKRLRMEGPVKGRGPVCRDLTTDLRRIKNEGVGCLVCCLDDPELALLGVPWETYRDVAAETGLDVLRLPMPDGFTPVSLSLFDAQISLLVNQYTLCGINILIHCRGGVGRAGLTACAWAIKMGFVPPHPSLAVVEDAASRRASPKYSSSSKSSSPIHSELEHQIVMSIVERVIAMIRSRRGLKAIESFEQVQFLAGYVGWLRAEQRA